MKDCHNDINTEEVKDRGKFIIRKREYEGSFSIEELLNKDDIKKLKNML